MHSLKAQNGSASAHAVRVLFAALLLALTLTAGGSVSSGIGAATGSLESGLGDGTLRGNVRIVSSLGNLQPTAGDTAALLTTATLPRDRLGASRSSSIAFGNFSIPAGAGTLRIDYNFLTNEAARSDTTDTVTMLLSQPQTGGQQLLLAVDSTAAMQPAAGTGFARQSGYKTLVADVSQYAGTGTQFSLAISVVDNGPPAGASALMVDNIRFAAPGTPFADANVEFVVSDPGDNVALDASVSADPDGTIVQYWWNFGDGNSASGATVSHAYQAAGTYQATLTVTDNQGNTSTDTFQVAIRGVNAPPAIVSSPNRAASEDILYSYQVVADDADVGDVLTYSLVTAPAGMTIDGSSGLITWTPAPGVALRNDVTVEVQDLGLLTDSQSYTIVMGPDFYVLAVDDSARLFHARANGDGHFSDYRQIGDNGANNRGGPAIADFDGDGDFDFVSGNGANPSFDLWYWERVGTGFMPPAYMGRFGDAATSSGARVMDTGVADFNNDGFMDFSVNGESVNAWLFLNNGNITFGQQDFFNGDFEVDNSGWASQTCSTTFARDDTTSASGTWSMRVEATNNNSCLSMDVNPSGWDIHDANFVELSYRIPAGTPVGIDINISGFGRLWLGGTASATPGSYTAVSNPVTFIDDDTWRTVTLDIYNAMQEVSPGSTAIPELEWHTGNNAPIGSSFWFDDARGYRRTVESGFTDSLLPDTGGTGRAMDAADVNSDGNADIVRARSDGMVWLYLGDGTGNFTTSLAGDPGNDTYGAALADFDSDNVIDLIAMNTSTGDPYFFKGNNDGTFQAGVLVPSMDINNFGSYATFDFNLDGNADMVVVDYTLDNLWFYPGNGDTTFGERVLIGNIPGNSLGVGAPVGRVVGQPYALGDLDLNVINEGDSINFDASTSIDDGSIVSYDWNFGDGSSGSGAIVNHTYTDEGVYSVVLTVIDDEGQVDRRGFTVTVLGDSPVSDPGGPYAVGENGASNGQWSLLIDGSASTDSDTSIVAYQWDFDDSDGIQIDAAQATPNVIYSATGVYTITLTVFDEVGQSATATTTITVTAGAAPVAGLTGPGIVDENNASLGEWAATYDVSSSSDDIGIASYTIDWGDGTDTTLGSLGDNFNDGDFTDGPVWTPSSSSNWEINDDGQLEHTTQVNAWRWIQALDVSFTDFQLEVDFKGTSDSTDGYLGITFHGAATSANTDTFLIYSRDSWDSWVFYDWRTATTLADSGTGWDPNIWYHLRLVVSGNRMQLYVTPEGGVETLQVETTDPSHPNGVIGLLSNNQQLVYDNLKVTPIDTGLRHTHIYDLPDTYPVTLTVTDHAGQSDSAVVNTVVQANNPPVVDAGGPYVLTELDSVDGKWTLQLDATASTDDVNVQRYLYDFGDGTSYTSGFSQGHTGTYFATGTELYGYGIPDASLGRIIATEDDTLIELIDLATDNVVSSITRNRFQTWNSVNSDNLFFKIRASKPVAAYLTDFSDHSAFMPSMGSSPVGKEFIFYQDVNDGFYFYAFEDAVIRVFDTAGNIDAEATLAAGTYWEPSTAQLNSQVYRAVSTGNIAIQTTGNDGYTTVPSSTGEAAGQLFYFATVPGTVGAFAVFAYDAADINVYDLDSGDLLYTNALLAGETWFQNDVGTRRLRVESIGDVEVWGGSTESGDTIDLLGDDTSVTSGRGGTEFHLHNLVDGIVIFAPNNGTLIDIDGGDISTTLNRDDYLALAPTDFPSGSGTHTITASQPILIQTLGAANGYNTEGTYLGGVGARHAYDAIGTYTLTVTAIDNAGQQSQTTTTVDVTQGDPPVPDIDSPAVVDETSASNGVWSVDFDASASTDDFGIFSYEWDFGDGTTGSGQMITHGYTATGDYTVTLTVTDLAGQQSMTTMVVSVTAGAGPVADAGGPYEFGEEAASFGVWTATLDGTESTDDVGVNGYVWSFDPIIDDDFAGTVLDTSIWTATDGVVQNDSVLITGIGSWGNRYLVSNDATPRDDGVVFETQARRDNLTGSATAMFGLKNAGNTNFSFSELIYGIYFTGTTVQIYEDGSNRGSVGSLIPGTLYDLRITVKAGGGALYEMKEAALPDWVLLYDSAHSTESDFRPMVVVNGGTFEIDNLLLESRLAGPIVTRVYDAAGTYNTTLTVTDHALQSDSDATTFTFTPGAAPIADAGGPYTVEVGALLNFNGTGSTDNNAIQQYDWLFGDTTGGPADANLPYSGRGPTPRHFYHATGSYQAQLTVTDNVLQTNTATADVDVVIGNPPTAVGAALNVGGAGGPPVYFDGGGSSDDYQIVDYRWDFDTETDSDGDGDPGNDIDGTGPAPFHVYPTATGPGGTLFTEPFDGTAIDSNTWLTAGAIQDDALTITGAGSWSNRYVFSTADYARGRISIRGQMQAGTVGSQLAMFGVKNTNTNYSFNQMPHAIYFNNGNVNIYELGSNRGFVGNYTPGVPHDVRIDLTPNSAKYFMRETGSPTWTQLTGFTQVARTETPLKIGATINSGEFVFDNFEVIDLGPYPVMLTVEDGAGQTSTTTLLASVDANPAPDVITVPWVSFDPLSAHETFNGKAIHLKGIVRDADADTFQWDFGDGTQSAVMPVTDPYNLEIVHTYPAAPTGTPFVAVLKVWDSLGQMGQDNYNVVVKNQTLNTEINVAIDEGLWFLHREQTRGTLNGFPSGNWTDNAAPSATASSLQAFQVNGHLETSDHRSNPYAETVERGLKFLFNQTRRVDIATQMFGEPDTNGNGFGIEVFGSGGQPIYQGGQVMDAIASTNTPTRIARTGPADVVGRRYHDILTDMSDQFAWGQTEQGSGGAWRYSWNSSIDNSAAQWGAIGLQAAEDIFGIAVPPWVKERNLVWLDNSYTGLGFGYTTGGSTRAGTPSGLVQLAFDDQTTDDPRWQSAEKWVEDNWDNQYLIGNTNKSYYSYYAFTKAMRLALPEQIVKMQSGGFDWFNDPVRGLARTLVDDQLDTGEFPGSEWITGQLRSAWGIIILSRTLFVQPPVADAGRDRVWAVDLPLEFDGSGSFHLDPFRSIVRYEWDFDGDGNIDSSGADPFATFTYTSQNYPTLPQTVTATLRVTDNNVPPISDTDTVQIIVAIPPHPPVAEIAGPYTCTAGIPCELDGGGSFDIDPTDFIFRYEWELDSIFPFDFDEASGANPSPVFSTVGSFNIGLRVFDNGVLNDLDNDGEVDEDERLSDQEFTTVAVVENQPPAADANGPYVVDEGSTAILDGSGSVDPNNDAISYAWDLDDDGAYDDAIGAMPSFTGVDDGEYPVSVEVSDSLLTDTASSTVTVNNVAPNVDAGPDQNVDEGDSVGFAGSFTDPGILDTHTIAWDFGDGNGSTGSLTTDHVYPDDGVFTVTLTITDDDGGVGTDTLIVTVGNVAPVVDAGPDQVVNEGDTVDFAGSFSDAGILDTHTIEWNFGDGNTSTGSLTPSNVYPDDGIFVVTLTVTDDEGGVGSDTLTVTVNNLPPVVEAGDNQTANAGDTVSLDPATFTDAGILDTHIASIDWGDGTVEPGAVGQGAGSGTVDGSHIFASEDIFTVTVTVTDDDGGMGSDTFIVNVSSSDLPPDADAGGPYAVDEGSSVTLDASNSSDPNGDSLTFAWDLDNDGQFNDATGPNPAFDGVDDGVYPVSVQVSDGVLTDTAGTTVTVNNVNPVVDAGNDQVADTGDTIFLDPATFTDAGVLDTHTASINWDDGTIEPGSLNQGAGSGSISGNHAFASDGLYTVTITVTDDDGGVGMDTFTVNVNQGPLPPMADAGGPYEVDEGSRVTLDATASSDPNGDALTFLWDFDNDGQFDDAIGENPSFLGVDDGVYPVSVQVSDEGFSDVASTTVTVLNVPPVVEAGNDQTADAGDTVSLDPASFTDVGLVDTHVASIDWGDGTVDPGAVTQGAGSGTVDGSHVFAGTGAYIVTVTVTDDDGGVGMDTFTVNVGQGPLPPQADPGGPYVVDEGSSVTLDATASSDPNGDALTYAWDLDNDGQYDDATGPSPNFEGVDDGVYPVSVQVSDGVLTDIASTTVTVNNVDPVVEAGNDQAADAGDTVSLDPASFTDAGVQDTHIASINWGDGTVEPGAVSQGAGSGTVDGSHAFAGPGSYTVTVTVTDDDGGVGMDSFTVNIDQPPMQTIFDLSARPKVKKVQLSWTPVQNQFERAVAYNVYRASDPGGPYKPIATNHVNAFGIYVDFEVSLEATYYYVVTSVLNGQESLPSNEAGATLLPRPGRR